MGRSPPKPGCPGSSCPPPQHLGLGDNRGQHPPPPGYSRVPPVAPAVPASRRSPGRDREELSVSCPRHQGLILPQPPPQAPHPGSFLPGGARRSWLPHVTLRDGEEVRGHRDGWRQGGDAARRRLPCGLSPPAAPANHRSPGHPAGHKMSPRPPPHKQRGRGRPGTPSTLGPVSPGSPLAPSAPARPCEKGVRKGRKAPCPPMG